MDRSGRAERSTAPVKAYATVQASLRLSPDGTRAALVVESGRVRTGPTPTSAAPAQLGVTGSDIWIWTIARGTLTRLSFTNQSLSPVWTPTGRRVCYRNAVDVMCQDADGSGQAVTVAKIDGLVSLKSFSPDGTRFLSTVAVTVGQDIVMTTLGPPAETRPLIQTTFSQGGAAISPDGRWLAYHSNESGRSEIFVRPFPSVERGRWQVSVEGGVEPRWAHSGRELFFSTGGGPAPRLIWSTPVQAETSFETGKPSVIGKLPPSSSSAYDVGSDGRILYHVDDAVQSSATMQQLVVVQHWFDELKARAPVSKSR
jgi:Tol biopolymer transport system component